MLPLRRLIAVNSSELAQAQCEAVGALSLVCSSLSSCADMEVCQIIPLY
jgi:hypothetical protein